MGCFDALVLGDVFSCFSHYRSTSPSSAATTGNSTGSATTATGGGVVGTLAIQSPAPGADLVEMVESQVGVEWTETNGVGCHGKPPKPPPPF